MRLCKRSTQRRQQCSSLAAQCPVVILGAAACDGFMDQGGHVEITALCEEIAVAAQANLLLITAAAAAAAPKDFVTRQVVIGGSSCCRYGPSDMLGLDSSERASPRNLDNSSTLSRCAGIPSAIRATRYGSRG